MHVCSGLFLLLFVCVAAVWGQSLQGVSDDELLQLIKTKEKLIVLFSKPNCDTCNKFEKQLESIQADFKKQLNTDTVKAVNSHLARLYNPSKEPALVFFRHGIPLLYNGEPDENEIYPFFEQNQTPAVKELTDKIFEHMTQAATGATTGDWFVMFYGASCVECQRLHAVWEGVGATLRNRVNVARIDANLAGANTAKRFHVTKLPVFLFQRLHAVWEGVGATLRNRVNVARIDANLAGANTAKRFHVTKLPAFLFFRLGKVYRYDLPKSDIKSFVAFAQDWYKNAKGEPVPLLASPFDELVDWCVEMLRFSIAYGLDILARHPWVWQIGLAGFGLVALTALIAVVKAGRSRPAKDTKKKSK